MSDVAFRLRDFSPAGRLNLRPHLVALRYFTGVEYAKVRQERGAVRSALDTAAGAWSCDMCERVHSSWSLMIPSTRSVPPTPTPSAWLEPSVHPVYVRLICSDLRRRGFTEEAILAGTRLKWSEIHTEGTFLSFAQLKRVVIRALDLTRDPALGLCIGLNTELATHGALGYAGMAASTVGEAMALMPRFISLRFRFARLHIQATSGGFAMLVDEDLVEADMRGYLIGHIATALLRIVDTLAGERTNDKLRVRWPLACDAWSQHVRAIFPHSEFDARQLSVEIPQDLWQRYCIGSDPIAHRVALRECERQLSSKDLGLVSLRLQRRLLDTQGGYPTIEAMARIEHVSVRTLIRKLRDEGTSYQRLLDTTREELACWLLAHTDLSTEVIAEQVAFRDPSSFSRAFKRWLGVGPREFRQAHAARTGTPPHR